jgi:hypothetical protein
MQYAVRVSELSQDHNGNCAPQTTPSTQQDMRSKIAFANKDLKVYIFLFVSQVGAGMQAI